MKPKARRETTKTILVAFVVLATCALAVGANAQSSFVGSFTLPHEVHWGGVLLPAGQYTISIDSPEGPAVIRSARGENKMFTPAPVSTDCEKGGSSLFVTVDGGEHRVRSLNLPQLGRLLVYKPLSKEERGMLAQQKQLESVPVITAEK
jgi:hypothetical protein